MAEQTRDWGAFEAKLAAGKLVEQAAAEVGIPIDEAKAHLELRRTHHVVDDDSLRVLAAEALYHGMTTLIGLAKLIEGRRESVTTREGQGEDAASSTIKFDFPDLGAAQELVRTGVKLRQMLGTAKAVAGGQRDLFDEAPVATPWVFKK